jgi:hypothetical protein
MKALKKEIKQVGGQKNAETSLWEELTPERQFSDWLDIDDLSEVTSFSKDEIEELVHYYPEKAVSLVQQLILELYERDGYDEPDLHDEAAEEQVPATAKVN